MFEQIQDVGRSGGFVILCIPDNFYKSYTGFPAGVNPGDREISWNSGKGFKESDLEVGRGLIVAGPGSISQLHVRKNYCNMGLIEERMRIGGDTQHYSNPS